MINYVLLPLDLLGNASPFHASVEFDVHRVEGRDEIEITRIDIFETVDGKSQYRPCPQWMSAYIEQDDYVIEECLKSLGTLEEREMMA